MQRLEYRAWTRPAVTREMDCDINTAELHALLAEKGDTRIHSGAGTWDTAVDAVLACATQVSDGVARVRLRYAYSTLGRALAEAGHITGEQGVRYWGGSVQMADGIARRGVHRDGSRDG